MLIHHNLETKSFGKVKPIGSNENDSNMDLNHMRANYDMDNNIVSRKKNLFAQSRIETHKILKKSRQFELTYNMNDVIYTSLCCTKTMVSSS